MKRHSIFLVLLIFFIMTACFTVTAGAETISIDITAQVVYVEDFGGFLRGAIRVGDVITGTYVYESSTPDTNADLTVGDYWHTTAPFGITVNAGRLTFRTDPNNVNFLVEIVNDHNDPPIDNYLLRSYNNIFDRSVPANPIYGMPVNNHIAWQLDDTTATALSSDALPTVPPTLANWQQPFALTIESDNYMERFFVRANVISAQLTPVPSTAPNLVGTWNSLTSKANGITGSLQVTNSGNAAADSFVVSYYLSMDGSSLSSVLYSVDVKKLNAGRSTNLPFSFKGSMSYSGKYIISVIDSKNAVTESNENDNWAIIRIP